MIEGSKSDPKQNEMFKALKKFKNLRGHPAMRELLHRVAGVGAASEVPAEKYQAVIDAACTGGHAPAASSLHALTKNVWDSRNKKQAE